MMVASHVGVVAGSWPLVASFLGRRMNRLITRPLVVLGVSGVALGIALTPVEVSADEGAVATVLVPAHVTGDLP